MNRASLNLHIDELIIHGLPHLNGEQLGVVVQQELTRLLAEQGLPPGLQQPGETAALEAASITVSPNAPVEVVGAQVARSVYGGLNR